MLRAAGWWVVLGTVSLHFTATSFVVTRLLDRGVTSLARGVAGLAVLVVAIGVPLVWTLIALPAPTQQDLAGLPGIARYFETALNSGHLSGESRAVVEQAYQSVRKGHDQVASIKHGLEA